MAASLGSYRDSLDKKGVAHLATVGTDGRPQVTPARKYLGQDRYPYRKDGERRVLIKSAPEHVQGLG